MNATAGSENKPFLERLLSVFADVRAGEAFTALLLSLNVFLLLGAYYIIKPVREALILASGGGGAEIKSYSGAAQAALFMFIVPAYGAFASRVNRIRLINVITIIFISNLVIFYLLSKTGIPLGVPFFLWIGLFNVMLTAQFWSFANDVYTAEQGKRLFAIVGFGSTIGAVSGSKAAEFLVKSVGVYQMMLVSAGVLGVSLVLYNIINQREQAARPTQTKVAEETLAGKGGFTLVMQNKYLLLIGLLTLIVNWVNTTGEYILGKTVSQMAKDVIAAGTAGGLSEGQIIGGFYANFQFWQNVIGALIQLFLVSRILKYFGIRWAIFFLPLISLSSYSLLALAPVLAYIRIAKIAENSTDYSLQNTVRHSLFLPTSREAKYKAKQAVDTFFWRFGDMMSAITVFVGAQLLHMAIRNFAIFNAVLVIGWIVIAASIGRRYHALAVEQPAKAA